jgi:hypothetical protein
MLRVESLMRGGVEAARVVQQHARFFDGKSARRGAVFRARQRSREDSLRVVGERRGTAVRGRSDRPGQVARGDISLEPPHHFVQPREPGRATLARGAGRSCSLAAQRDHAREKNISRL